MDSLHDRIGFLLRNAYQNLNRDFRKELTRERITIHQYVVLQGLDDLGEAIQRTLAEHCAIEPSNLNVMIKRMKAVSGDYFPMMVKPHVRMVGVLEPTWVLGTDLIIYCGAHVPDETIYKFVKAVHPNKKELAQGHPSFFGFQPKNMNKQFSIAKYHPGADKFYKEAGILQGK
ncbi:MAG: hypothetical protein F4178_14710 [Rhodospirillaceae bacterium]|nr:hypothetical protein [Rhodospirillaceae bacterium]